MSFVACVRVTFSRYRALASLVLVFKKLFSLTEKTLVHIPQST